MPRLVLLAALVAGLAGCNPIHTNVPPLTGDTAFHSPNTTSVVDVEATAMEYVLKRYPAPDQYALDLPYGSTDATYAEVLRILPEGGHRAGMQSGTDLMPTYRVAQVRLRRTRALVDIVVPANPSEQLVTVTCIKEGLGVGDWYARSMRIWRVSVEQALMMSTGGLVPADEPDDPDPAEAPSEDGSTRVIEPDETTDEAPESIDVVHEPEE